MGATHWRRYRRHVGGSMRWLLVICDVAVRGVHVRMPAAPTRHRGIGGFAFCIRVPELAIGRGMVLLSDVWCFRIVTLRSSK